MKNFKLLIVALLFNCSLFAISPAKADPKDNQEQDGGWYGNKGNNGGSEKLPINNQVWFLIIAGAVIGCKVIINKNKEAKAQASFLK